MKKWHNGLKLLAIALSLALAVPFSVISAVAASATTKIKHKSPKEYIPGFRINLDAEIKDDVGVLLARCYFKTKQDKNFAFVDMLPIADRDYRATLPAPWVNSEAIDYVFVVVNEEKKVVRSQVFIIKEKETEEAALWKEPGEVKELRLDVAQEVIEDYEVLRKKLISKYQDKLPEWQEARTKGEIEVKTEIEKVPDQLEGFYDNVVVTEVPASMKYGMLAEGIYPSEQIAAAGGQSSVASATGAASVGTVTAGAGLSTAAIVGIAAVVAGGAAAAGGGGGGGDDDGGGGEITTETLVGNWYVTEASRTTGEWHMYVDLRSDNTFSLTEYKNGIPYSGSGSWSYDSSSRYFVMDVSGGGDMGGTISGSINDFYVDGHWTDGNPGYFHWVRQ